MILICKYLSISLGNSGVNLKIWGEIHLRWNFSYFFTDTKGKVREISSERVGRSWTYTRHTRGGGSPTRTFRGWVPPRDSSHYWLQPNTQDWQCTLLGVYSCIASMSFPSNFSVLDHMQCSLRPLKLPNYWSIYFVIGRLHYNAVRYPVGTMSLQWMTRDFVARQAANTL